MISPNGRNASFSSAALQQQTGVGRRVRRLVEQAELDQVVRRDRQRDRVSDRLVEPVVRAVAQDQRQPVVGPLIEIVSELVVDRREILVGDVDAHLDAQVVHAVDVPRARMAHDLAIARLDEQRPLPEGLRQRLEAERREEPLADAHHLERIGLLAPSGSRSARAPCAPPAARRAGRCSTSPAAQSCRAGAPGSGPSRGPPRRTSRAAGAAHVGVQRDVKRPQLLPQPVELLRRRRRAACRTCRATSRRCPRSQRLRALVRQLDEARVVLFHRARRSCASPSQTSCSHFGSRLSARISVIASMSRQSSPVAPLRAVLAAARTRPPSTRPGA